MGRFGMRVDATPRLAESVISGDLPEPISMPLKEQTGELHDLIAVRKPGGLGVDDENLHVSPTRCDAERCAVLSIASWSSDAVSDVKLVNGMS